MNYHEDQINQLEAKLDILADTVSKLEARLSFLEREVEAFHGIKGTK